MYILAICTIVDSSIIILAGLYYKSKTHTVDMICSHPELSEHKVKAITDMMIKQHNFKFILKVIQIFISHRV